MNYLALTVTVHHHITMLLFVPTFVLFNIIKSAHYGGDFSIEGYNTSRTDSHQDLDHQWHWCCLAKRYLKSNQHFMAPGSTSGAIAKTEPQPQLHKHYMTTYENLNISIDVSKGCLSPKIFLILPIKVGSTYIGQISQLQ